MLALALSLMVGRGGDIIVGDAAESFEYARVLATLGHLPTEHIRFPAGVAMLGSIGYLPAYALGQLLVDAGIMSVDHLADGRALWLQLTYCLPILALSIAGFLANLGMLRELGFADSVAKPVILFWIVTTNVGYYTFKEPAMTESATYATVSLFYYFLVRWSHLPVATAPARQMRLALFAGLAIGLAGAVRQQNILHSLSFPLLLLAQRRWRAADWSALIVAAAGAAVVFAIPWLVWAAAGNVPLMSYTEGKFYWTQPKPWLVLFVPGYHGLLLFHPVLWLALVGLAWYFRDHTELRLAVAAALLVQLYLMSTWYWLSLGASIGHRGFMTVMPLLLIGLAAFAARARAAGRAGSLVAAMAVLATANAAVILLVLAQVLDPTGAGYPAHAGFR